MHEWEGGWHMGWMWILWALAIVAVIAVVWKLARRGGGGGTGGGGSAEDVLKRRYAEGDISESEFEQKLADLRR